MKKKKETFFLSEYIFATDSSRIRDNGQSKIRSTRDE